MKIARVLANNVGGGVVQSLHNTLGEALIQTPRDRDGCENPDTRYWAVPDITVVGDVVNLTVPDGEGDL